MLIEYGLSREMKKMDFQVRLGSHLPPLITYVILNFMLPKSLFLKLENTKQIL